MSHSMQGLDSMEEMNYNGLFYGTHHSSASQMLIFKAQLQLTSLTVMNTQLLWSSNSRCLRLGIQEINSIKIDWV